MTQYIKKLPAVFQTVTEKKFFDATFDQVLSKKDSDLLNGYLGRRNPGNYNPITDFYLPEPTKDRTWWQLEATAFARTEDSTKSNIFFYDDLLNKISSLGGNTLNQDRLFESEYYSWAPPIDVDMFINYQNYYWIEQGLPTIIVSGTTWVDIVTNNMITPVSASPAGVTLASGMTISLPDDPAYPDPMVIENFGGCRKCELITVNTGVTSGTVFEFLPWDGIIELSTGRLIQNLAWDATTWDTQPQPATGDYITIERGSVDGNGWSSTNRWFNVQTINQTMAITNTPFPQNATRAMRPIIQFVADLNLYPGQIKTEVNQAPLFMLYDHNGKALNDAIYPNSTFVGSKIFSYKENTAAGAPVDSVLKFPIVYSAAGQTTDIMFQNNLITDRYTYNEIDPINGYYYYKKAATLVDPNPTLYNGWNLYDLCNCPVMDPAPINCVEKSKQRVIDKFVVGYGTQYQFKLSVEPYGYPTAPDIIVSVNGKETTNYSIVVINNDLYVDLSTYLTALLLNTQSQAPVVEVQTYTHSLLEPSAAGYFEIPQQLEANPTQLEVGDISIGDLIQQFSSIIENQIGFTGTAFGGNNNYKDSPKNTSVGAFILQNKAPLLKTMLVSSSDDLDFVTGERFSQDEYTKFKNKFVKVAKQLIDQEFNPTQFHNGTILTSEWTNEIIRMLGISKEFSDAFAYSYMIANGAPDSIKNVNVPISLQVVLSDPNYADLSNVQNTLYIYNTTGTEKILMIGRDYTVTTTATTITIDFIPTAGNVAVGDSVYFYIYKNPLPAYIPSTPTKLGMYPTYIPRIELDTSYAIPTNVIIGHDGSKTIAYGDYRDNLLIDLETRIYNLLNSKFRNQYAPPVRLESVKPGYFRETRYSRQEFLDITESYLNKWAAKNRANYRANDWTSASTVTPVNQLWKLYNYSVFDLPGNWKGIYQYYYDTIYPNTRPWEMLGFSSEPSWWEAQYGSPIVNTLGEDAWPNTLSYASMWADLENGIIRQGPTAIYDPVTLLPQEQPMWARPGLAALIPVDAAGDIIPVPTLFSIPIASDYSPFDYFDIDWKYGDGSPVEQTWMSTSGYAFTVQEFLYLMKPAEFGEMHWDTYGTELSPGMITVPSSIDPVRSSVNWQYVQNDSYESTDPFAKWMRPKNKDQIVHAESIDGVVQVRYGYQRWISDRILFLGKDVTSTFGQKVRTLDVNLANKLGGFTNKDTVTTYIESITTGASNSTLLVPSNNFDVILHNSPPVDTYVYSGVVIRSLADGTFIIYGYDLLNSEFITLNRSNAKLIDITVGGTPASFSQFATGETYAAGDLVRYNGVYYQSLETQVATKFISSKWQKLRALPTIGGMTVSYKPISETTITKYPYGSVMKSAQEVFDFLIGWGAYLESRGWDFTEVNQDTNIVSDWLYSAKQFLFWLNTAWAPDASIQLSPLANNAKLTVKTGYPNDVENIYNGVYSILDKHGVAIPTNQTVTDREGHTIVVSPADVSTGGIFFLQVHTSETEHILMFDNSTSFGDVIYSPLLRARQQRLRFNGFRSNGWYGKMEAPGYLVIDNQLVPNFDTIVDAMRYYYDPNVTIDNPSLEDLGRHLIGYESKSYLDNLELANDVQYLFYQGAIRQKGTKQAFDKLFRSTKIQNNDVIEVYEEWALKVGDFGNTVEQVSTEFKLVPEQNSGDSVVARLNFVTSLVGSVKQIGILNATQIYKVIPQITIGMPDTTIVGWKQAKAYAVLDTVGRILRVDISDPGYGYLSAPTVVVSSPVSTDLLYSVWQGEVIKDTSIDNIINIDIDQTDVWTVRPTNPEYSLEFPVTSQLDYPVPNAGYVNFNDVDLYSFDAASLELSWGTRVFNPIGGNTIWIANTFTQDWGVYKLFDYVNEFAVIDAGGGNLQLITKKINPLITPQFSTTGDVNDFGNMIALYVNEATATATIAVGSITDIVIVKTGSNYNVVPDVSISGDGFGATATAVIAGGIVSSITIDNPGSGYTFATVTIDPPVLVGSDTNIVAEFSYNSVDSDADVDYYHYDLLNVDQTTTTTADIPYYLNFTNLLLFKSLRFDEVPVSVPSYISTGNKVWIDGMAAQQWSVKTYTGIGWANYRAQENLINSALFQSATVFSTNTQNELVRLPVYDPFKNILPGIAKQNISYMSLQDPARYNVTSNDRLRADTITFGPAQVGKLWWDLSQTKYVYYEQPIAVGETEIQNLTYRRDQWGQIFPGSTIAIYEWVQSDVPPTEYTGTGTPRDLTSYVQLIVSNQFTSIVETKYYFWVLNTTDKPNIENRTLAALDVSRLLQSPKTQGYAFFAPIQQTATNNSYMFYNVQEILAYQGNNIQVQYRVTEREDQKHTQWAFFREGDTTSFVTDQFWDKMVDSLCAYTKPLPISGEYNNGIPVTLTTEILPVPDPTLSSGEKYGVLYRPRQGMFVNLSNARKVFVQSANSLLQYIPIKDNNPSWNADVATSVYWKYTNWVAVGYESASPDYAYRTFAEATAAITNLAVGKIVKVLQGTADGRFIYYVVEQVNPNVPTKTYKAVTIENSAIKLLDTIYTVQNVYGLSVELRELLNAFRTQVMIDSYVVDQNELFFSMLNFVISEQRNPNWVFKSSYVFVKENNKPLSQSKISTPSQIDNVIAYITDAKPYHTQVRDYTSTYTTADTATGTAQEGVSAILSDLQPWDSMPWDSMPWDEAVSQPPIIIQSL